MAPRFTICIPNYNYERYIGETIQGVLDQEDGDLEVIVADNCSTDRSVEIIRGFEDPRVKLFENQTNVGFARNLDMAAKHATGDIVIMVSSDDVVRPQALSTYRKVFDAVEDPDNTIVSSTFDVIDAEGSTIGRSGPRPEAFSDVDRDAQLQKVTGFVTHRADADVLLRRCLRSMTNPFNFASTAFPRKLYDRVEGYGGGRLMNPDKWFHWRLLQVAKAAVFVDEPLFCYRWHAANQTAQQAAEGALKYLVDEYATTLEMDGNALRTLGLERTDLVDAFVEYDIARHGLATLAKGQTVRAARILNFGRSTYPHAVRKNKKAAVLAALLRLGPVGARAAGLAYKFKSGRAPGTAAFSA